MKYIKLLIAVIAMNLCSAVFAQNITVSGVVTNSSTGEPEPFTFVQVKGTQVGTSTDFDGLYTISAPSDGVLVFSLMGYKSQEIPVAGKTQINVVLSPDSEAIEETIVVAFGSATKESFTGSATVVKSADIAKTQSSDVTRALEGVVAGVQMTTSTGTLGSSPSIMIRGASSMSAGTAPLYVVDGIPYSGDMNNINPADIESMTVLKDAASNALYGARGANGVIMITTKKAKRGDAIINFDAKWGLNTKALKDYDVIKDPGQYYEAYYKALRSYYENPDPTIDENGNMILTPSLTPGQAHINANVVIAGDTNAGGLGYIVYDVPRGESLIGLNGKLNPNASLGRVVGYDNEEFLLMPDSWIDEAYKNSLRQEYNISVSGSGDKISMLASFGYLNNKGIVDGSDMYRYTARLRADYQAKSWLKIGANLSYTNYNWNNGNSDEGSGSSTGNIFAIATGIAPIYPIFMRNPDGSIKIDSKTGYKRYDYGEGSNGGMIRPYLGNSNALLEATIDKNNAEGNAFNGTTFAEIKFLKDFTFTFNAGLGVDETRGTSIKNKFYGMAANVGGMISKSHSRSFYMNLQQLLNWKKTFGVHNVSVLLGHENYVRKSYGLSASKSQMFSMENDELNGAVVDGKNSGSSFGEYNNEGYFVRAQYDYMNRIFASASYRRDASSRFHPDHRWGNFWSLGGGWIINHEQWFPQFPWLDMLKVKASIGSQGNDNIGDYLYTDTYYLTNNQDSPAIGFGVKGNKEITWETNTNFNAGFDIDLLRGRVSGSIEYFYRKTSDMLFWFTTPISLGYSGYYDNIGDMRNSGIELAANVGVIRNDQMRWDVYVNMTHYTNKITMLPTDKKTVTIEGYEGYANGSRFVGEGLPLNTFYLPKSAGVEKETGRALWYKDILAADNQTVIGQTTTTEYSEATQYLCGAPTPDLYGGFGTSFEFMGFDISASFTYSIGGLSYDSGYAGFMTSPTTLNIGGNFHKDVFKGWTPENKDSEIPRFQYQDQYTASSSDRVLTDASYLNFQNAQIGYTLPERVTKKIQVSRIRVYAACDNIVYWSRRQGFDPRFSFSGNTNSAVNSPVRTISGGINITF